MDKRQYGNESSKLNEKLTPDGLSPVTVNVIGSVVIAGGDVHSPISQTPRATIWPRFLATLVAIVSALLSR